MDDIHYLLKNCQNDSAMLILDSSKRDKYKYPVPAEYVVEFTQPFRFVYGFDIIDATIPATMYSIDTHNNLLCFGIFTYINPLFIPDDSTVFSKLSEFTKTCPLFETTYASHTSSNAFFCFCNTVPAGVSTTRPNTLNNINRYMIVGSNLYVINNSEQDIILNSPECIFILNAVRVEIEIGNYSIYTLQTYLKRVLSVYNIDIRGSSTDPQIEKQMRYRFVLVDSSTGSTKPFFMDMTKSTCSDSIGFEQLPSDSETYEYIKLLLFNRKAPERVYGAVKTNTLYQVYAPGVVNLLGVRYITLRCPELESHLLGSLGFGSHNTGLGTFKLQSPYEVSNLKFDFFNFVKKPFHPIGKLNKLTIRFERENGELFNFRGVNHQILITIKYYVPALVNKEGYNPILNPNYEPDYIKYMVERDEILNDDADDDSDYEEDNDNDKSLLKRYVFMKNSPTFTPRQDSRYSS